MTNQELSLKILELVGGKDNVASATNCMTRLRIQLKDGALADIEAIKATEGVLGVVEDATLQVVLGPGKARKVRDLFVVDAGVEEATNDWQANKAEIKAKQGDSKLKAGLRTLTNIFTPLIPAIIAAGLLSGIASLLSQVVPADAQAGQAYILTYNMITLMSTAFLSYFAVYTGISAAQQFGATPALGGMLGFMSIGAQVNTISAALGLYDAETTLNSILTTGKGGVIGVIIGVWVLSKVEKKVRSIVPDVIDLIVTTIVTIVVVGIFYVIVLMPITGF